MGVCVHVGMLLCLSVASMSLVGLVDSVHSQSTLPPPPLFLPFFGCPLISVNLKSVTSPQRVHDNRPPLRAPSSHD